MSCCMDEVKPSRELSNPRAAITPPPGIPGAAIMVTPNMKMNGVNVARDGVIPFASMIPRAPITRHMVSPARWMVAPKGIMFTCNPLLLKDFYKAVHSEMLPKGMTKSAISLETPFFLAHSRLTGIVEAEDWVPSAVK